MVDYCLDTNVIIDFLKGNEKIIKKVSGLSQQNTLFITSVSLCELYKGIYLYSKGKRFEKELDDLEILLQSINFITLDTDSCNEFGKLFADLSKKGSLTQDPDLMIASICKTNDLVLVTKDKKHFRNLGKRIDVKSW